MYGICFVNSMRSWGGAEVWMLETASALRAHDINARIIAQPGSELLRRARTGGVPAAAVPVRFDTAPWTLANLWHRLRLSGATAIVANLTKDLKAAAVAGRLAGISHILATRESDFPLKDKLYYRWYFGRLATGVLVNSRATRTTVLDSAPWLDPARVHLLYKGIDTARFVPRAGAPQAGVIGFAGQLIERKGLADLMSAWSLLEGRNPAQPLRLRLAGDGPLRHSLVDWRRGLHRPEQVEIVGYQENIVDFYHGLDALVLPSLAEGFGLAAAEAASCGVPVVATRASSLPEVVIEGETGLLVPPHDPPALAAALERIVGDSALAARLGRAGRRHITARFRRETTLQRLLDLTGGPTLSPRTHHHD